MGELGHEGDKLEDAASVDAKDFGSLGVCHDGLTLEKPEPVQTLKDGVDAIVVLPLSRLNPGDLSQLNRFFAPYED